MTASERRIALVTPWYGRDQLGGAERLAWDLAHALVRAGADVEVLTTCCRSFHDDWGANYFRSGAVFEDRITVRRFKVDSRDRTAFGRANARLVAFPRELLHGDRIPLDDRATRAFFTDNITSRDLLAHLRERGASYDAVLFTPYLYGPTVAGLPLVADRAFLIPCLHDETYAYLEPVRTLFDAARGLLFNSDGEADVAAAIYGPAVWAKAATIGHAVEPVAAPRSPISVSGFVPQQARYVLALGRQDRTKNIDFLIEAFKRFRAQARATSLQLVLAGPQPPSLQTAPGVIALGAVREDVKAALLTYARALAQPSINESFSRAIYEAWWASRPAIAHAECLATARAVEAAGAGWVGETLDDWVRIFTEIDECSDDAIAALGARGRAAAIENGSWDDVAMRTIAAVDRLLGRAYANVKVDQVVPLGDRDATRAATALNAAFRSAGIDADIRIAGVPAQRPDAFVIAHGEDGVVDRCAPVDPGEWSGLRLNPNPYADGRITIVNVAPLGRDDARAAIDVLATLLASLHARLIVHRPDCDAEALDTFTRECRQLDLADALVLTNGTPEERFAAFRAASVACALGRPIPEPRAAVEPLWFDVPVVAYADPVTDAIVAPSGLLVDTRAPRELAAVLAVVAREKAIRNALCAEGRRIRARYAPWYVVRSLIEQLTDPLPAKGITATQ